MKTVNDVLRTQRKPSKRRDTIVFSESARRSYVTGFKKRKDERREIARVENEKKARAAKIEARKDRRQAIQFALSGGIANRTGNDEPEDDDAHDALPPKQSAKRPSTKNFVFENTLTTTTVTPIVDSSDPAFQMYALESNDALAARLTAKRAMQAVKRSTLADKSKQRRKSPNVSTKVKHPARSKGKVAKRTAGTKKSSRSAPAPGRGRK